MAARYQFPLLLNSGVNLAGALAVSVIILPCIGLFSRTLPVDSFALLVILLGLPAFGPILCSGVDRVLARESAQAPIAKDSICFTNLDVLAVLCLVSTAGFVLFGLLGLFLVNMCFPALLSSELSLVLTVSSIGLVGNSAFLAQTSRLDGAGEFVRSARYKVINTGVTFGLGAVAAVTSESLIFVVVAMTIGRLLYLSLFIRSYPNLLVVGLSSRLLYEEFIRCRKEASGLLGSAVISQLTINSDKWVVYSVYGGVLSGIYSACSDLVFRFGILPGAVAKAIFPSLASGVHGSQSDRLPANALLLLSSFVAYGPFIMFPTSIAGLWLGEAYSSAPEVIQTMAFGGGVLALASLPLMKLQVQRRSRLVFCKPFSSVPHFFNNFVLCGYERGHRQ